MRFANVLWEGEAEEPPLPPSMALRTPPEVFDIPGGSTPRETK